MMAPPPLRGLRCAIIFLTRVPVGGDHYRDDDWRWSTGWFPAVGLMIGLALSGIWLICTPALTPWVVAALTLAVSQLLTGGFHEDGLADTADALGGAYTQDRILEILKDSRVGAFGAMALCTVLILRASLWVELSTSIITALVLSQSLSRVVPIWLMVSMEYVTRTEAAKSRLVTRARVPQVILASLLGGGLLGYTWYSEYITAAQGINMLIAMLSSYAICYWRFKVRLGGITGDFLGSAQQISECAILMGLAWVNGS